MVKNEQTNVVGGQLDVGTGGVWFVAGSIARGRQPEKRAGITMNEETFYKT